MFSPRFSQKEAEEQILAAVEAQLGRRQCVVEINEKRIAAQWARLNECLNFVTAALADAGHPKMAEAIMKKVKANSEGEQ